MSKAKDVLNSIKKVLFGDASAEQTGEPAAPASYKLKDGSEISADKLEVGGKVTIAGEPAAEGEYELEDGSKITVDATGVITSVTAKAEEPQQEAAPDFSTPEGVQKAFEKFENGVAPDLQTLSLMVKALFENVFGWQLREVKEKQVRDAAIAAYQQNFAALQEENKKQKQVIEQLFQAVEEIVNAEAEPPAATPKTVFQKHEAESKEDKMKRIASALKKEKQQA